MLPEGTFRVSLSDDDQRTLERLEAELSEDPGIGEALRSMPRHRLLRSATAGGIAFVIGAVATIGFLSVTVIASFVGFIVMLVGALVVLRSGTSSALSASVRFLVERGESVRQRPPPPGPTDATPR